MILAAVIGLIAVIGFLLLGSYRILIRIVSQGGAPKVDVSLSGAAARMGVSWSSTEGVWRPIVFGRSLRVRRKSRTGRPDQLPSAKKSAGKKKKTPGVFWRRAAEQLVPLAARFIRLFRIRRLAVDGTFGLGDPCRTGRVYGWLSALPLNTDRFQMALFPDFQQSGFCGEADFSAQFNMARLVALVLAASVRLGWIYFKCKF